MRIACCDEDFSLKNSIVVFPLVILAVWLSCGHIKSAMREWCMQSCLFYNGNTFKCIPNKATPLLVETVLSSSILCHAMFSCNILFMKRLNTLRGWQLPFKIHPKLADHPFCNHLGTRKWSNVLLMGWKFSGKHLKELDCSTSGVCPLDGGGDKGCIFVWGQSFFQFFCLPLHAISRNCSPSPTMDVLQIVVSRLAANFARFLMEAATWQLV